MPARNIWRSKRLVYKPVETTDEPFLESLNHHGSDAFIKATDQLPVPQGPRGATQHREFLQSCLLGCIIYLPAPEIEEDASSDPANPTPENNTTTKKKDIPIGTIALQPLDLVRSHHRATKLGISIHSPHQKKGYGSEAILWALEWAFKHANLHRIGIEAFAWNEGAWKLYERLGFVMEGRARECVWFEGGWGDVVSLGMLGPEWWGRYGGKGSDVVRV